jgi:cyclohexanecarboxylate-CoA ligase
VTLRAGYPDLTLEEGVAFLLEQGLTKHYLPEYLEVLEALPHLPSGKTHKFERREQAKHVRLDGSKRG